MGNIISIICALLLAVFLFIEYLKDKKTYRLLAIIIVFISIYFKTSFASGISKTFENISVGIVVILTITIFYLLIKDNKEKK